MSQQKGRHRIDVLTRVARALRLVWLSAPGWTAASAVLCVTQGLLPMLVLYLMKLAVDTIVAGLAAPDKGSFLNSLILLVGFAGIVALTGALCRSLASLVSDAQSQIVTDHTHDIVHAKSVEVDLEYYENSQYHDSFYRAQQEASFRPNRIVNGLTRLGQSGVSLVVMAFLLLTLHPGVAALLFIAAAPGLLVRLRFIDKVYRWRRERTSKERQASYFDSVLTRDAHAKEVRLFELGAMFIGRFRDLRTRLRRERLKMAIRYSGVELVTQACTTIAVFSSYAFIACRALHGSITMGDLIMYFQAFQKGQDSLREMASSLADLYEDSLFLSSLYEFLDLKPRITNPTNPRAVPRAVKDGIAFDRVSFRYATSTRNVLEDITLRIRPGERIALVGENGSGKTTLIKLVCRLYDPTSGAITLDGVDLRQFNLVELRARIGVIFQDYAHYHLTAQDNIWLGNINLPPNEQEILRAARRGGADGVITGLPQGYKTVLGKWFEDGEELSAGEWQKIALSRAFLRDAQIIALDEPTSAMDAGAEYEVFEKFRNLTEGRISVLISHRLSTVKMADRIYVLEKGKVVENGSHDELVRRGGAYARMFELQAQYYR